MEKISLILPVYNEERNLRGNVKVLENLLDRDFGEYEIIILDDGSNDTTPTIAKELQNFKIRTISNKKRIGKGASIKQAAKESIGEILIFVDADLASNPNEIKKLVEIISSGADIVIGSRYLKESKTSREIVRYFASKSFNILVRMLLGSKLSDHQCGFKAFRRSALEVIDKVESKKWFWDTEFLVRAQRDGLKISEIPIEWKEMKDSKFNLIKDSIHMGISLVKFKIKNW